MERSHFAKCQSTLNAIPFFAGLRPDVLEQIHWRCAWRRYEPHSLIVDYLDTSDDVFFVIEGEVRVTIYSVSGKVVSFCDWVRVTYSGSTRPLMGIPAQPA